MRRPESTAALFAPVVTFVATSLPKHLAMRPSSKAGLRRDDPEQRFPDGRHQQSLGIGG
jgi:hypothetical protein